MTLKPRDEWPRTPVQRWYSAMGARVAPSGCCARSGPTSDARTLAELARDLDAALRMPGYQMAISPPIRTRIDMLTTGVRTPVGIKVFGPDLAEIERLSIALEGLLRKCPGHAARLPNARPAASTSISRPTASAIARYGLSVRDVQ